MWEFLIHFTGTDLGKLSVVVVLLIVIVAVFQIVRGDWKIVRTKEGKTIFTTAQQRTAFDTSKEAAKLLQRHVEQEGKQFDELKNELKNVISKTETRLSEFITLSTKSFEDLRRNKEDTDLRLAAFIERSDMNDDRILNEVHRLKQDQTDSKSDRKMIHDAIDALLKDTKILRLESIKSQIMINAVSLERKLHLYDKYKELGGNGWMDLYIAELKNAAKKEGA